MRYSVHTFIFCLSFFSFQTQISAQNQDSTSKMQWFSDAKLGIFIHWGIYAVDGISESWSFHNKKISHADYMKQLKGFTAKNYDPKAWASLIKESGAQYAVITTKHHDGVALWDTKMNDLSVVKKSQAKRDVLSPFVDVLRKEDIKVGAYFSLIDWTDKNYPGFLRDSSKYDLKKDTIKWNRFLKFYQGQINELSTQFNPDLFWFDGDWEHNAEEWQAEKVRKSILKHNPNAIINGRLQGFGDYETPEQNFPVSRPTMKHWELCMTMNDNWGYQPKDTNYKTPFEIISIFADCISMGGNMLLDIAPKADGTIPEQQVFTLKELGKWTSKHKEAIFGSLAGLEQGHFYGPSTLSKDSTVLYLFVSGNSASTLVLKGLDSKIKNISVLGKNQNLTHKIVGKISWSKVPGLVYVDLPKDSLDTYMTVLKVELDSKLKTYRGHGGL